MPFHDKNNEPMPISCGLTPETKEALITDDELIERKKMLQTLKEQIRAGTYKPTIGEIAISLVRGQYRADFF
ncbi:flagellar biosynthesis anti-sigma factor FlgM [Desulfovibrio sp. UCD-KL4C]|uniref:flagellar biosynthesis anti-sigma factor FlgM n=1 Tax=Desulfovibrio sp. UCD-KL4C TaxID=2578120 RepID=UPI0025BA3696|nr:flagellar biosynthesis anti-sigma factor FlgM [Desulfovibrio sp. UCD-KL4C]